jgi:polar amino acid transport system substrate-binding protein
MFGVLRKEKGGTMNSMQTNLAAGMAVLLCMALAAGCDDSSRNADPATHHVAKRTDGALVLAISPELPPYAYMDTNRGVTCGIDIDIVKAAAERLRRPLKIVEMPFDRLIPAVRDLEADFAAGAMTITDGRRHEVEFSIPYAEEGAVFIYHAGSPVPTMVRAEGMRVGAVESMTQDFYLTRHGIDPFRYGTIEQALNALMSHRVDTVFYDRSILVEVAKASGGKLAVTPLETRENYGIAVRKDRTDYIEAVNAVIRERRAK